MTSQSKTSSEVTAEGVMKAVLQAGSGETPSDEDLVLFHFTVRSKDGKVLFSTAKEHGGSGVPRQAVLGYTKMLPGLEQGLRSMQPEEASMIKLSPEAHFRHKECSLQVPEALDPGEELMVEVKLLAVFSQAEVVGKRKEKKKSKRKGKKAGEEFPEETEEEEGEGEGQSLQQGVAGAFVEDDRKLLIKKVTTEGSGWERARVPYEVQFRVSVKQAGAADPYFASEGPLHVMLGQEQLPASLDRGLESMLSGEHCSVFCWEDVLSAEDAKKLRVPTPPTAGPVQYALNLDRIVQVRDVLGNGAVTKKRLIDGQGEFPVDCPLEDCVVRIHYKGTLPGHEDLVFVDTREENGGNAVEVGTGEGLLPEALETSIRVMLPGETAVVTSTAAHAYDKFTDRPEKVPLGARVQWEVELVSFQPVKRWEGLTFREIMDEVEKVKQLGNGLFKRELFPLARAKYEKMIREMKHVHPQNDDEGKELGSVTSSLQLNVAACYHKTAEYKQAIEWTDKVLEGNPIHGKALFRRGQAFMMNGDYEEARRDFKRMVAADYTAEKDGSVMLAKLKRMEEDANQKQREQFKGLFDKNPRALSASAARNTNKADMVHRSSTEEMAKSSAQVAQNATKDARSWASWIPLIIFVCMVLALLLTTLRDPRSNLQEL